MLTDSLPAVYFEQGDFDKCIETCEKAVDEGRSVRLLRMYAMHQYIDILCSYEPITSSSQRLSVV